MVVDPRFKPPPSPPKEPNPEDAVVVPPNLKPLPVDELPKESPAWLVVAVLVEPNDNPRDGVLPKDNPVWVVVVGFAVEPKLKPPDAWEVVVFKPPSCNPPLDKDWLPNKELAVVVVDPVLPKPPKEGAAVDWPEVNKPTAQKEFRFRYD